MLVAAVCVESRNENSEAVGYRRAGVQGIYFNRMR